MNDDYSFEDKMKSLFDEERAHRYDPKQWNRLSRRLREHDRPTAAWWQRWMPVGFAVLVGLLGWQVWQQQDLRRTVADLSAQLAEQQNEAQAAPTPQSKTITIYDTVYRRTVIETTETAATAPPNSNWLSSGINPFREGNTTTFTQPSPGERETNSPSAFPADFTATALQEFQRYRALQSAGLLEDNSAEESSPPYFITDFLPSEKIRSLTYSNLAPPTIPAPAAPPYEFPRARLWQRIKPKGYTLSVGAGVYKSWAYASDDGHRFADLNAEIMLGKRLSLDIGTGYFARSFSLAGEEDNLPDDLPVVAALNDDDELETISGTFRQLQFPIGLRYYAVERGRFRFYGGAGIAPVLGLPSSSVDYAYEEEDTEETYVLSAPRVLSTNLRTGAVYASLGLQAGLGNNWRVEFSTTFQQPLGSYTFQYQQPAWGRWRLGVGYDLK